LTAGLGIRTEAQDWQQQLQTDGNYVPYTSPNDPAEDPRLSDNTSIQPLGNLNENAASLHFQDRQHGLLNIGAEFKGAWTDNFYDKTIARNSGHYFQIGIPFGLALRSPTTVFTLDARSDTAFYHDISLQILPSYSFSAALHHENSSRTAWQWALAGGRFAIPNESLPAVIGIGNTGVAQPIGTGAIAQGNYLASNLASTLGVTHFVRMRDSITASITAGWTETAVELGPQGTLRDQVAGATAQWSHQLSPFSWFALQTNAVYVRGLQPIEHGSFTALEASYRRTLNPHFSFNFGAGPLVTNVSGGSVLTGNQPAGTGLNYTAHGNIDYTSGNARFGGGYARVIALGYGTQASTANQLSLNVDRRLTRNGDLTLGTRYIGTTSNSPGLSQTSFGFSTRYNLRVNGRLSLFAGASRTQQSVPARVSPTGNDSSYSRDELTGGMTITLQNQPNSLGDR
jgi:hypothetical protein